MIDRATAERIKDTADIVEVVSDYVHLTRRGSNYMGLCPFHNERTPSFSVNRRRNFCYCFSCHKGGSPVNFIMEKEGISYHDALLHLAKKYGIPVEERTLTDEERQLQSLRESMLVANEWAMNKMHADLTSTDEGRDVGMAYFHQRGLTQEAIIAFHLGYALDSPTALADAARSAGYDIETLKAVGLVGISQHGSLYDRFRGRVIFPILNTSGKTVAFGGRDLKGGPAKYVNSPESEIYKKNRELYGIYQAKNEIVRQDKCFLVEGYMDVIGMWQAGMKNVVASSGTALTDGQIALIHRFTENITLLYDGDNAGIKASLRGIDMLLSHKMKVKVLLLPDGHDPDSFARDHTPEEFRKYVEEHETDIIRFKIQVMLTDAGSDPLRRSEAIRSVVRSLACVPDPITANVYIQECSKLMDVDEKIISRETRRMRSEMLEKIRLEKRFESERQRLDNETSSPHPLSSLNLEDKSINPNSATTVSNTQPMADSSPLLPLEKQVARYCARYGVMDFCEGIDAEGNPYWLNVAEYIQAEMEADKMEFTNPGFTRLLQAVTDLRDRYLDDLGHIREELESEKRKKREEGIASIAAKELDISSIEREEEALNKRLEEEALEEERLYAASYTGRILASAEDDFVRRFACECLADIKPLSRRFDRMGSNLPEHERLIDLVPRAINEWKQGNLRLSISRLTQKIANAETNGDHEAMMKIMEEISRLQRIQKEAAKAIGDRVLSPRSKF